MPRAIKGKFPQLAREARPCINSGAMNDASQVPPIQSDLRQALPVLVHATPEAVRRAFADWATALGFRVEENPDGALAELGVNRQRQLSHRLTLRQEGEITLVLAETRCKGQTPGPELDARLAILDSLAPFRPEYIRTSLPPIHDGEAFQEAVRRHLADPRGGAPFILVAPPHAGRGPAFTEALRSSADIDILRVGARTARRLRAGGFPGFTRGTLLLRRPGHRPCVLGCGDDGEGLLDAVKRARDSLCQGFRLIRAAETEGDPLPSRHRRFPTVAAAVAAARETGGDILTFHDRALESAAESLYHDPDWVHDALASLAEVSRIWAARESLGGSWKDAFAERGFDFTPHSSETALGKHGSDYTFLHQGERVVAEEHLSRGRKGSRNTIRIYLARLEGARRVLVCHIGQHLPTASRGT